LDFTTFAVKPRIILLSIFKINDPYKILVVFFIAIIIQLPIFISGINVSLPEVEWHTVGNKLVEGGELYVDIYYPIGPLSAQVYRLLSYLMPDNYLIYRIFGLILVIIQAVIFNYSVIQYKAYNHNTYVPSLIYVMLMMGMEDYITLSPQLMGLTFIILSISLTFRLIEGRKRNEEDFLKIGLYTGLSVLFYPLNIFLILPIVVALLFFTNTVLRRYLLLTFGFILPLFLTWLKFFWKNQLVELYYNLDFLFLSGNDVELITWKNLIALGSVPLIYLGYALLRVAQSTAFVNYQVRLQKYYFLYLIFGIVMIFLDYHQTSHILVVIVPVAAFFISHLFLMVKKILLSEVLFLVFLFLMVLVNYNSSFGIFKWDRFMNYSDQYIRIEDMSENLKGQRILVLGEDTGKYYKKNLATPYLSWIMLERQIRNLDNYDNIIRIYENISKDPPDIIIDDNAVMPDLLTRMPELSMLYKEDVDKIYLLDPRNL
jgi:hypothetical protein